MKLNLTGKLTGVDAPTIQKTVQHPIEESFVVGVNDEKRRSDGDRSTHLVEKKGSL